MLKLVVYMGTTGHYVAKIVLSAVSGVVSRQYQSLPIYFCEVCLR